MSSSKALTFGVAVNLALNGAAGQNDFENLNWPPLDHHSDPLTTTP